MSTQFCIFLKLDFITGQEHLLYTTQSYQPSFFHSCVLFLQGDTQVTTNFSQTRLKGTTPLHTENFLPLWISFSGQIPRGGI